MGLYSAVTCYEEHGSATESYDDSGMKASVKLRCAWSNRHLLAADLLFNGRVWPNSSYTIWPRARTVAIAPEGPVSVSGQSMVYEWAILTVNYTTEQDEGPSATDLVSESLEPTVKFAKLDHRNFRWGGPAGNPLLEGEAPGKLVKGMNLVRNIYRVPGPLPADLINLVGSVNDADYTSAILGLTFPQDTLLYNPPQMRRTISTAGTEGWNLTLKFTYQENGWNKYFRSATNVYEQIYPYGDSNPFENYPQDDFSAFLF